MDDAELDGGQTATISALAAGWIAGSSTLSVFDNDANPVAPAVKADNWFSMALT